jgi:hypothetical protein
MNELQIELLKAAPLLMSERQVASLLGVDRRYVRRLSQSHQIRTTNGMGRFKKYFKVDVAAFAAPKKG